FLLPRSRTLRMPSSRRNWACTGERYPSSGKLMSAPCRPTVVTELSSGYRWVVAPPRSSSNSSAPLPTFFVAGGREDVGSAGGPAIAVPQAGQNAKPWSLGRPQLGQARPAAAVLS